MTLHITIVNATLRIMTLDDAYAECHSAECHSICSSC